MASCVKLSGLLDIKLKIAIQLPKTYIYPLFRALSTTTEGFLKIAFGHQEKTYKVYNIEMYFKQLFTCLKGEPLHL